MDMQRPGELRTLGERTIPYDMVSRRADAGRNVSRPLAKCSLRLAGGCPHQAPELRERGKLTHSPSTFRASPNAEKRRGSSTRTHARNDAASFLLFALQECSRHARKGNRPFSRFSYQETELNIRQYSPTKNDSASIGGPKSRSHRAYRPMLPTPSRRLQTTGSHSVPLQVWQRKATHPGSYWPLTIYSARAIAGSLVVLPYDHQGKQGSKAPTLQTGIRTITAFETDGFDDLIAVGGENGQVNVFTLPGADSLDFGTTAPSAHTPSSILSVSPAASGGKAVETMAFHPLASALFLASSQNTISVFDVASQSSDAAYTLSSPSPSWSAQWSNDGRSITATGKDGKLRCWDVRAAGAAAAPVVEIASHAGIKASRHVHLGSLSPATGLQVFTTGFSRTRDREYSVHDFRNLRDGAVKTQRVDTGTGVLVPLLDSSRGIVYLAGKGDMTLRWTELGGPGGFTEGEQLTLFRRRPKPPRFFDGSKDPLLIVLTSCCCATGAAPLPVPIVSAALAPPSTLELMKAEINRLVVLGGGGADAVLPVSITVPRRQYLDFHADLYPPVASRSKSFLFSLLRRYGWPSAHPSEKCCPFGSNSSCADFSRMARRL